MEVTKDFQKFVDGAMIEDYNEIYEFYQVAAGEIQSTFNISKANGNTKDELITRQGYDIALRLSPKQKDYLPSWIEANLMNGLDAETYWGYEHAMEKAKDE